ncbi:hypothetical protein OM428_08570 [Enterococcus gallinarum]|nr:hypothetical protein [Enterococcus gallinarum]
MYQIHHIQITVNDVKKAEPFYDQLFHLLGLMFKRNIQAISNMPTWK